MDSTETIGNVRAELAEMERILNWMEKSKEVSQIDIDILLAKTRSLYSRIIDLKAGKIQEPIGIMADAPAISPVPPVVPEPMVVPRSATPAPQAAPVQEPASALLDEPEPESENEPDIEPDFEPDFEPEFEPEFAPDPEVEPEPDEDPDIEPEPEPEEVPDPEFEPEPEFEPQAEPELLPIFGKPAPPQPEQKPSPTIQQPQPRDQQFQQAQYQQPAFEQPRYQQPAQVRHTPPMPPKREPQLLLEPIVEPARKTNQHQPREIIAESTLFQRDNSLNETLGKQKPVHDIASTITDVPVSDIWSAITINERFLFIRELFGNDPEGFKNTVTLLNSLSTWDAAQKFMTDRFEWDKTNPVAIDFLNIVRRRFLK